MRRSRLFAPMLVALVVAVGLLAGGLAQPASASHGARITIHNVECDSTVSDIYGQCHGNGLAGVPFNVAGVWRETTLCMSPRACGDGYGIVSWTPGQGTHTVWQDWDVFSAYEGAYVYCSNQVTGQVLWDGLATSSGNITIRTTAGQEVICDWYNLT